MVELGIIPIVEIQKYPVINDVKKMLEYIYNDAVKRLHEINQALSLFDDDYITKDMIQKFIIEEKEHLNWVKQHLNLIKKIGYQNYLIEQTNIK